jgi:hypothetical protein
LAQALIGAQGRRAAIANHASHLPRWLFIAITIAGVIAHHPIAVALAHVP